MHRLAHKTLCTVVLGHDILHHVQMLDLRLLEYFLQIVDMAAGNAARVEALDPVRAVFARQLLIDRGVERIAIHRAARLVAETLVGDPFRRTQGFAKALPDFRAEYRDVHVAVASLVDAGGNTGRMIVAGLPRYFAVDKPARRLKIHHVHHRLQERGVQPLPFARGFALQQRDQNTLGRENTSAQIGDRNTHAHRALFRQARDRHQPAHALCNLIEAGPPRKRAGLTEAGDAGVYQPRLILAQRLVVDTEPELGVGTKIFDHDIGRRDQTLENADALGFL